MARSIHVEVRKALVAGIKAAVADDKVSVTYGWEGSDDNARREQIFTSNARGSLESAVMRGAGRNFRKEQMEFDITIIVEGVGQKPEDVETRAMTLGLVVEEFIADHKSNELGITGLNWLEMTGVASDYRIAPEAGSIGIVTYSVRYNARLT